LPNQTDTSASTAHPAAEQMAQPVYAQIVKDGLWHANPGLVQLLGLCPLLAVSNTLINGLGLGLATLFTLVISSTLVSCFRTWLKPQVRIPAYVLLIATVVTAVELSLSAWLHDLYLVLGIFIPLIVTNCMIIGRAESFASRQPVLNSLIDAFAHGCGFMLVLVALGGIRELLGYGTLMRDAHLLFGAETQTWVLQFWSNDSGLLIALLPPGAFMLLGLLLALRNLISPA